MSPKNFKQKKKTVEISRESWMNKGQEKGLAYHVSMWLKSLKINFHIKAAHVILHTYFGHYFLCYHNEMRPKSFNYWLQIHELNSDLIRCEGHVFQFSLLVWLVWPLIYVLNHHSFVWIFFSLTFFVRNYSAWFVMAAFVCYFYITFQF